jgi:hypothetical protein
MLTPDLQEGPNWASEAARYYRPPTIRNLSRFFFGFVGIGFQPLKS